MKGTRGCNQNKTILKQFSQICLKTKENYVSKIKKHMNTMYHQIEHQQRHGHYYKWQNENSVVEKYSNQNKTFTRRVQQEFWTGRKKNKHNWRMINRDYVIWRTHRRKTEKKFKMLEGNVGPLTREAMCNWAGEEREKER